MIWLWVALAALTVIAAANLSRPWWSAKRAGETRRRSANVAAYRQRLAELDTEVEAGLTGADAAVQLRQEADSRLVGDASGDAPVVEEAPAAPRVIRAATLLSLILAVYAGGYYYQQGSWKTQAVLVGERVPDEEPPAPVEEMVAELAKRVQSRPDDVEGWSMLARSYTMMQRYTESAEAYAHLNEITDSKNPEFLTNQGEMLALAADRDLRGKPQELFEKALLIEPLHGKSLWYAGMAEIQSGDTAMAREHWTLLRQQQDLPPEMKDIIDKQLAELGGPAPDVAAAPAPAPATAAASPVRLVISLSLAPELASKLPKDAVLIVFAKAEQGPPMPLAVHRGPAGQFPVEITLDDSMAMMPSMKLSSFDRWVVTARLSSTGQAKAESGDLQGSRSLGRSEAAATIPITIDQVLP